MESICRRYLPVRHISSISALPTVTHRHQPLQWHPCRRTQILNSTSRIASSSHEPLSTLQSLIPNHVITDTQPCNRFCFAGCMLPHAVSDVRPCSPSWLSVRWHQTQNAIEPRNRTFRRSIVVLQKHCLFGEALRHALHLFWLHLGLTH